MAVAANTARRSRRRWRARCGFTLIEVILALVVLGGALAIFGEVMQLANSSAVDARAETQAQLLATSLMDEILAGARDDSPVSRQALDVVDVTRWMFTVEKGTTDVPGVFPLAVIVEQDLEPQFNPVKFRLVRWLPTVAETSENDEEAAADEQDQREANRGASAAGGGSGSAGGSGSGSGGATGGGPP